MFKHFQSTTEVNISIQNNLSRSKNEMTNELLHYKVTDPFRTLRINPMYTVIRCFARGLSFRIFHRSYVIIVMKVYVQRACGVAFAGHKFPQRCSRTNVLMSAVRFYFSAAYQPAACGIRLASAAAG